jgi:hypothetical protein
MVERAERQHPERAIRLQEDGGYGVDRPVAAASDNRLAIISDGAAREVNNLLAAFGQGDPRLNPA